MRTLHTARKTRTCGMVTHSDLDHDINAGELYIRSVAFPGDEGWEEGTRPWVIEVCTGCADQLGDYVRHAYKVPAHVGGRIFALDRSGTIGGFVNASLLVRFDGEKHMVPVHPHDAMYEAAS